MNGRNELRPSRCRMALGGRREGRNLLRPWRGGAGTARGLRSVNTERAEARGHGEGFEVGLRAASPTGEGREMIGWKGDGK